MELSDSNWFGINPVPATMNEAINFILDKLLKNVNVIDPITQDHGISTNINSNLFDGTPRNSIRIPAYICEQIRQLVKQIFSFNYKFPNSLALGNDYSQKTVLEINGLVAKIMNFADNRGMHVNAYRSEPAELHWLTVGNVKEYNEDGVGLEPPPTGDNENVLNRDQIQSVDVGNIANVLARVGRLRFDTVLIRNLIFIVNLYRSVRMKLARDLVYSKDIIKRSAPITSVHLTEFFGNQVDHGRQNYKESGMWRRYNY